VCVLCAGKLERCFSLAASRIPAAGYFAFSVETLDEEFSEKDYVAARDVGFRLRRSGRYAHSPAYVRALAEKHGFTVKHEEEVTVRTEQVIRRRRVYKGSKSKVFEIKGISR